MMTCPHCANHGGRFYVARTITDTITVECDEDGGYELYPAPQTCTWQEVTCAACFKTCTEKDARTAFLAHATKENTR